MQRCAASANPSDAPLQFTTTRFATRTRAGGRATLMQNVLRLRDAAEEEGVPCTVREVPLEDAAAYAAAAREHLGIALSPEEAAAIFAANAHSVAPA